MVLEDDFLVLDDLCTSAREIEKVVRDALVAFETHQCLELVQLTKSSAIVDEHPVALGPRIYKNGLTIYLTGYLIHTARVLGRCAHELVATGQHIDAAIFSQGKFPLALSYAIVSPPLPLFSRDESTNNTYNASIESIFKLIGYRNAHGFPQHFHSLTHAMPPAMKRAVGALIREFMESTSK